MRMYIASQSTFLLVCLGLNQVDYPVLCNQDQEWHPGHLQVPNNPSLNLFYSLKVLVFLLGNAVSLSCRAAFVEIVLITSLSLNKP
jgi:hypothetical protein